VKIGICIVCELEIAFQIEDIVNINLLSTKTNEAERKRLGLPIDMEIADPMRSSGKMN